MVQFCGRNVPWGGAPNAVLRLTLRRFDNTVTRRCQMRKSAKEESFRVQAGISRIARKD